MRSFAELAIQPSLNPSLMPRTQQNDSTNVAATSSGSGGIASGGASATAASSSSANAPLSPVSSGNYYCFPSTSRLNDNIIQYNDQIVFYFLFQIVKDHLELPLQHLDKFQVEMGMVAMATEALRLPVLAQMSHQQLVLPMQLQVLVKPWRRVQQYKLHRRWVS